MTVRLYLRSRAYPRRQVDKHPLFLNRVGDHAPIVVPQMSLRKRVAGLFFKATQFGLFGEHKEIKENPDNHLGVDRRGRPHWRATPKAKPTPEHVAEVQEKIKQARAAMATTPAKSPARARAEGDHGFWVTYAVDNGIPLGPSLDDHPDRPDAPALPTVMKILHRFEDPATGMGVQVAAIGSGYSVAMQDLDSHEYLPSQRIFPYGKFTEADAVAYAKQLLGRSVAISTRKEARPASVQQPPPRPAGAAPLIPVPDIARQIASTVDISVPQAEPEIGNGAPWLRESTARKVAAEVAHIDAMNIDTVTPGERVEKIGKRWAYRALGDKSGRTNGGLYDTRKEALAAATRNADVATEMAAHRLDEELAMYAQHTPPAAMPAPQQQLRRFRYGVHNRPVMFATVPRPKEYELGEHPDFRHGTVSYSTPLTRQEMEQYELSYLPEPDEVNVFVDGYARQLAEEYGDDPDIMREVHDDATLVEMAVGAAIDKRGWHLKRADIARRVVQRLAEHIKPLAKARVGHSDHVTRRRLLKEREQITKDLWYLESEDYPAAAPDLQPALDSKRKALKQRKHELSAQLDEMEAQHVA